jgi:DeoR family transcriptional regulator, suf operon transcriptional repressor
MRDLNKNERTILEYLLDHSEGAPLDELASHLKITKTAARAHVLKLETAGYLMFRDSKGSIGRPRRNYFLSTEGRENFPRKYAWLSNVLLELLAADLGGEAVETIMKKLADKVAGSMESSFRAAKTTPELLQLVTATLNDLGYRASLTQTDIRKGAIIEATNCVYHAVAKENPSLCTFDVKFIENATNGMSVTLESCIARGGAVCRFCLKKNGP